MECDVCSRGPQDSLDFLCASCARSSSYLARLKYAQVLLEKGGLVKRAENSIAGEQISDPKVTNESEEITDGQRVWQSELRQVHIVETKQAIEQSKASREQTRIECQDLQDRIAELRAKIAVKRKNLETIQKNVVVNRDAYVASLSVASSNVASSLVRLQNKSTSNRAVLCREAAFLMRLRQRRRQKDASGRDQYSIAGLTLPDLREISNVRCVDLTAVLGSTVHLVLLVAFYLGIRLPAEVNMPAPEHPLPTIHASSASYTGKRSEMPRSSASSTSTSPSASKHEIGASLKPRPLFIGSDDREERIFTFQKREPHVFNLFVEGITLLAWNVAWLCRTQGHTVGTNSWDEICNIGKNLHQLLIAHPQSPSLTRMHSERIISKRPSQSRKASTAGEDTRKDMTGKLAHYSDTSAATSATRPLLVEATRSWDFSHWQAVALPLRKTLLTEIASADWELLRDQEWDDGGEQFDEAVFVKARTLDGQQYDDARSIMTSRVPVDDESANKLPGTSGWTKLKSRDK